MRGRKSKRVRPEQARGDEQRSCPVRSNTKSRTKKTAKRDRIVVVPTVNGHAGIHPAADALPPMTPKEYVELVEDIRANGLMHPCVVIRVDDGSDLLLDGRHRERACRELGIEPQYERLEVTDPIAFVLSANLHRRHLDEGQRALIATELAKLGKGQRADQMGTRAHLTQAQAAKALNVSPRSVKKARKVRAAGSPELVSAVERGETSLDAAYRQIASPIATTPTTSAPAPKLMTPMTAPVGPTMPPIAQNSAHAATEQVIDPHDHLRSLVDRLIAIVNGTLVHDQFFVSEVTRLRVALQRFDVGEQQSISPTLAATPPIASTPMPMTNQVPLPSLRFVPPTTTDSQMTVNGGRGGFVPPPQWLRRGVR